MAMSTGGGGSSSVQSSPNVTPMIDVMLVLLIIFMVVTPALLEGFAAEPPKAQNLKDHPEDPEMDQVLGLDRDGNYYLNKKPITPEALPNALAQAFVDRPEDKILYLKAHSGRPYRDVMIMMDIGRDAGALMMAAVSESKAPPAGAEEH